MNNSDQIKVWDSLIRLSHWGLVAAFYIAFLSEDNLMSLHLYAGYTFLSLLTLRLIGVLLGQSMLTFQILLKHHAKLNST